MSVEPRIQLSCPASQSGMQSSPKGLQKAFGHVCMPGLAGEGSQGPRGQKRKQLRAVRGWAVSSFTLHGQHPAGSRGLQPLMLISAVLPELALDSLAPRHSPGLLGGQPLDSHWAPVETGISLDPPCMAICFFFPL